jgi:hypothetical protein
MELILQDIKRALDAGASYAALASTVTLPEVCSRCELLDMTSTKGLARGEALIARFAETYLRDWKIGLNGADLANLRNGLSHRAQTIQANQRKASPRYIFHTPTPGVMLSQISSKQGGVTTHIVINLNEFCDDIAGAVRRWLADHANNPTVQKNLSNVIQRREGLHIPGMYIQGAHHLT